MQTFLPYPDFEKTVRCLDWRRLAKQRVECNQILKALSGETKGWRNHPATLMWKGYEDALLQYKDYCIAEWVKRGYVNNMDYFGGDKKILAPTPPWFGDPDFHASHRSNLLRKDPVWYGQFGWSEPNDLPYIWPSKKEIYESV
jgi:hypothetical protein